MGTNAAGLVHLEIAHTGLATLPGAEFFHAGLVSTETPVLQITSGQPATVHPDHLDLRRVVQTPAPLPVMVTARTHAAIPPGLAHLLARRAAEVTAQDGDSIQDWMHHKVNDDLRFLLGCFGDVTAHLAVDDRLKSDDLFHLNYDDKRDWSEEEIRVMSFAFLLLNLVEENVAVQARRRIERQSGEVSGLWPQRLRQLKDLGFTDQQIAAVMSEVEVELVATTHPTESRRNDFVKHLRQLYLLFVDREHQPSESSPREQRALRDRIVAELHTLWRTGEFYTTKPTLKAELERVRYYTAEMMPDIFESVDAGFRDAWMQLGHDPALLDDPAKWPKMRVRTWAGGDCDGHDLVTAEIMREALSELRHAGIGIQTARLARLAEDLPQSNLSVNPPEALLARAAALREELGEEGAHVAGRHARKPFKEYVAMMLVKLPTDAARAHEYKNVAEVLADLKLLRESLVAVGEAEVARAYVFPAERRLMSFGFHTAALDYRQDSGYHDRAIGQILTVAGVMDSVDQYTKLTPGVKTALLRRQLEKPTTLVGHLTEPDPEKHPEAAKTLARLRVRAEYLRRHGKDGLGPMIVSMTRGVEDMLAMFFFAKEAGLLLRAEDGGLYSPVPDEALFGTIQYLRDGPRIMTDYFSVPLVMNGLRAQSLERPAKPVMLGYSDSAKDGSILTSQWGLYLAQEALIDVAREFGI